MGILCCCFQAPSPNPDDDQSEDGVNHGRSCNLFKKFAELFRGEQMQLVLPESPAAADLLRYNVAVNNTINNATNSPTTLQIESNSANFSSQRVVLSAGAALDYLKQITSGDDSAREFFDSEDTLNQPHSDEELKQNLLKISPHKEDIKNVDLSLDNEDLCPICLEEFIPENPETVLQCTHCYHLGCTYEWMERSPNCPICARVMLFDEPI